MIGPVRAASDPSGDPKTPDDGAGDIRTLRPPACCRRTRS